MNQIKIGAFISERRKAKGWTQSQLAEKLEITDKAVSKWETGRSMPDLSLFMPLCTLLDVTLNELFAGECIAEEKLKEKADEVLMDVITNWLGHDKWESKESDTNPENVLEVENVSKLYENVSVGHENILEKHKIKNNSVLAVNDVSFQVPRGSFVGIMGASGSGKTTLLNLIATIDKPTSGAVRISGQNIVDMPDEAAAEFRRRHLGFVFQEYNLLETLTIYENIALALTMKEVSKESIRPMIRNLSEKLDISTILDKFPYEVSGGQRQRCACARAIVVNPDIILADEPTGALDSQAVFCKLSFICCCHDCPFGDYRNIQLYSHYRRISRISSNILAVVNSSHSNSFSRIYRLVPAKAAGKRICKLSAVGYGKKEINPVVFMRSPVDWFLQLYGGNNNRFFHIWIMVFT